MNAVRMCLVDPQDLRCILTLTRFRNPVVAADGRTYERSAIQKWFDAGNRTSPVDRSAFTDTVLRPNILLKTIIEGLTDGEERFVEEVPSVVAPPLNWGMAREPMEMPRALYMHDSYYSRPPLLVRSSEEERIEALVQQLEVLHPIPASFWGNRSPTREERTQELMTQLLALYPIRGALFGDAIWTYEEKLNILLGCATDSQRRRSQPDVYPLPSPPSGTLHTYLPWPSPGVSLPPGPNTINSSSGDLLYRNTNSLDTTYARELGSGRNATVPLAISHDLATIIMNAYGADAPAIPQPSSPRPRNVVVQTPFPPTPPPNDDTRQGFVWDDYDAEGVE